MFEERGINPILPPNQNMSEHCEEIEKQTFDKEEERSDDSEQAILSFHRHARSRIPDGNDRDTGVIGQSASPIEGRYKPSGWGAKQNCAAEEEEESKGDLDAPVPAAPSQTLMIFLGCSSMEPDFESNEGGASSAVELTERGLEPWNDQTALSRALLVLTDKSLDAKLDVFLWAHLTGMVGVLNLYLDPSLQYTWRGASEMVSKVQGCGVSRAHRLQEWILTFSQSGELPVHNYGQPKWNVLDDEDISQSLQSLLMSYIKGCYITARDVVEVVSGTTMQDKFSCSGISHPSISKRTACRWLKWLSWCYGPMKNGMYMDGHEREDVVAYRTAFVARWKEYEKRFHTWDSNGVEHLPQNAFWVPGAGGHFQLILVTHDESVFYQNDFRKTH